jgi:hypothetical protein
VTQRVPKPKQHPNDTLSSFDNLGIHNPYWGAALCLRIPGLNLKAIKLTELLGNGKMYNG